MILRAWTIAALVALVGAAACGSDEDGGSGGTTNPGGGGTGGVGASGGSTADGGGGSGGGAQVVQESEPNDGATETEYDDLALDQVMMGAIGTAGDSDVFRLPTTGATPYEALLEPEDGSPLQAHLTVIDDGRGGDPAGGDFVKIVRTGSGGARLQWMAMGAGGYFLAVRDARNVDGQSLGDDSFTYRLTVTALEASAVTVGPLPVAGPQSGSLAFPGAIDLYPFDASEGQDALIDMMASGDLDGRLFVVAASTADWIARADDRDVGDPNPLIDAPLSEAGGLTLVVESIAETPSNLGYTLSATLP